MSFCCKGGPKGEDHAEDCANNPARFEKHPDASAPKADHERKLIDPETRKRFEAELRSLQDQYRKAKSDDA